MYFVLLQCSLMVLRSRNRGNAENWREDFVCVTKEKEKSCLNFDHNIFQSLITGS